MQLQLGPLVDVAIVLCGLFIAISVVCSFVTEQIAVLLQLRGQKLFTAVQNLVFDADLATKIFAHPLIAVTVNDKRGPGQRPPGKPNRPSYIDPVKFAAAFWDELANASKVSGADRANAAVSDAALAQSASRIEAAKTLVAMRAATNPAQGTGVIPPDAHFEDLRQVVNALPADDELKQNALVLLATAKNDYDSLLAVTASWFNHQMDRVSGWYKRQTQYIIVGLAALLIAVSGLDTLEIARGLYASPTLLAGARGVERAFGSGPNADPAAGEAAAQDLLRGDTFAAYFHPFLGLWHSAEQDRRNELAYDNAALANEIAEAQRDTDTGKALVARDDAEQKLGAVRDALTAYQAAKSAEIRTRLTQAIAAAQDAEKNVASLEKAAQTDIEAGRATAAALATAESQRNAPGTVASHWFGWLITLAAAALGAPFWFQVLCTFMNVRGAGPKPETPNVTPGITPSATTG
jgi:hypothetical protein